MGQSTSLQDQTDTAEGESPVPTSIDQPSSGDSVPEWITLSEDERIIWEARASLKRLVPDIVLSLLLMAIGAFLLSLAWLQVFGFYPSGFRLPITIVGGVLLVGMIFYLGYSLWSHRKQRYVLTSKSVYRRWGNSIVETPLSDVLDVCPESRSVLDKLFSCGDLTIIWEEDTQREVTFPAVPHSEQVGSMLLDRSHINKDDSRQNRF